jgi:hypothetical protein
MSIEAQGLAALAAALRVNSCVREFNLGYDDLSAELARHYRVPRVRFLVRMRAMCQAHRARTATDARRGEEIAAWLCGRAPLWVAVQVCALLRDV